MVSRKVFRSLISSGMRDSIRRSAIAFLFRSWNGSSCRLIRYSSCSGELPCIFSRAFVTSTDESMRLRIDRMMSNINPGQVFSALAIAVRRICADCGSRRSIWWFEGQRELGPFIGELSGDECEVHIVNYWLAFPTFCTIGLIRIGMTRLEITGGFSATARSPIVCGLCSVEDWIGLNRISTCLTLLNIRNKQHSKRENNTSIRRFISPIVYLLSTFCFLFLMPN